jgi:hypothetical protein
MMPAFSMRMSRREVWDVIRRAHSWTDFRDEMSHLKKVRFALGVVARMEEMSLVALCSLRPLKKMCAGSCFARAAMEPAPRPAVPVGIVSGRLGLIELMLLLASSDEDDLAGQVWDVGIWVEGVGSHCFVGKVWV